MEEHEAIIDLCFPLRGTTIPADHGYLLYAAISRPLPSIHGADSVGIHPIRGQLVGHRLLALTRDSHLVLRLPAATIPDVIRLARERLGIGASRVLVGVPAVRALAPVPLLGSRLVVIRGFTEADAFLEAARRQLPLFRDGRVRQAQPRLHRR